MLYSCYMKKPTVVQFISDKRAEGKTDSQITHELLDAGWHMDIIAKAMHGEPIRHRNLDPILEIKKQPFRIWIILGSIFLLLVILIITALFI